MKFLNILFLICLFSRLCFVGRYPDSCDSINFALGLHDYDLSVLQPHFPGYPVYMFISRLLFKLFHQEVWALIMPGVFFGSLTVYPLYLLARRLFSERVAVITAILYVINPLCWLQAERPASDAMGLFFIVMSAYFLFCTFEMTHQGSGTVHHTHFMSDGRNTDNMPVSTPSCSGEGRLNGGVVPLQNFSLPLFLGSFTMGLGFGVRLSYFPFILLWVYMLFYLIIKRTHFGLSAVLYGLAGFAVSVCLWLIPQICCAGWHSFLENGLAFSHGHFTDWGGSVITFGGVERVVCLIKSIWADGMGGWWQDASFLRLMPSLIMMVSIFYAVRYYLTGYRLLFLGIYIIPYMLWVVLGQNVSNPRHIMPVIPVILMLTAHGLCNAFEKGNKGVFALLTFVFIVSMPVVSFKLVSRYHNNIPAPIQMIQFIERHFHNVSTRVYCSNDKRFFDYYAPSWDVREVRDMARLKIDLNSSMCKPQDILLIHTLKETGRFDIKQPPVLRIEGVPYTDDALLLCTLNSL